MAFLGDFKACGSGRLGARLLVLAASAFAIFLGIHIGASIFGFARLFHSHSGITLTQEGASQLYLNSHDRLPAQIPKIVHQVFHNWAEPGNDVLPADWAAARQHCSDLNPKWEFKLWTEKSSREFIETEYPWFLRIYDGYRLPVQRVDAIRYFVLEHYGGIYIDLDNGCLKELTPLIHYPFWIANPSSGALNNNLIGSAPHHPFWTFVLHSLYVDNYDYLFTFPTVHSTTGQWFITRAWEKYHSLLPKPSSEAEAPVGLLYLLAIDDDLPDQADPKLGDYFFTQERGGTWNGWDSAIFLWLGNRSFPSCLAALLLTSALVAWRFRSRLCKGRGLRSSASEKIIDRIA